MKRGILQSFWLMFLSQKNRRAIKNALSNHAKKYSFVTSVSNNSFGK
jgi:hypothetical protein